MRITSRVLGALPLVLILTISGKALAAIVDRSIEVITQEKNPAMARKDLMDKAQNTVIEDLVKETLGDERFQKVRAQVQSRILKMSSRLIPSAKSGELISMGESYKMTVQVRVNIDDLDQLLIKEGLYFESDVPPLILPVVSWLDKNSSESYAWWAGTTPHGLSIWSMQLEKDLRAAFLKEGFYVLKPQALRFEETVPKLPLKMAPNEVQTLTQNRQSQVAMSGEIQILDDPLRRGQKLMDIRISVVHLPRNRTLAQVSRRVDIEKNLKNGASSARLKAMFEAVADDLADQTTESWKRGAIQTTPYKVTLLGAISPVNQEAFREAFRTKVREVKSIRERFISSSQVSFEVDSLASPPELAKRVADFNVNGVKIVLKEALPDELRYQIIPAQ